MKELGYYIPRDRRLALCAGQQLPENMQGSLLLADLSGFTPMTTVFFQELGGGLGAEMVTQALNRVYDALIEQVYNYRGSIISFSGDAIICFIEGDEGRKAVACSLGMQKAVRELSEISTPAGTVIPIGVKIIATAGRVRRILVGNEEIQQLDVLAGPAVERLGEAEKTIQRGEIMVGAEIIDAIGDVVEVDSWRASNSGEDFALISALKQPVPLDPWTEDQEDIPLEIARRWLLGPVHQRLERGQGDFLAELRTAVTLFLRFRGSYWSDDSHSGEKLNAFICWVQAVVSDYGGYLVSVTMGDKGSYLHASFGAPVSRGDNPRRAVEAAQALLKLPEELSFIDELNIGISQGRVWAGAYGGSIRKAYSMIGKDVNISARLMDIADPWQILVTSQVAEIATGLFENLGSRVLKGLDQSLPVFTLSNVENLPALWQEKQNITPKLVGRQRERAWLRNHLDSLFEGNRNRLLIEGEPGIGKSSLVQGLILEASEKDAFILFAGADAIDQSRAYHPWTPLFYDVIGGDHLDPLESGARMLHFLEEEPLLRERASLLNTLFPFEFPMNELTEQMDADVRARNLQELLAFLLKKAAPPDKPWLLIMDDIQWLDSASWGLLEQVWRDVPNLLVVLVARSHMFGEDGAVPAPEFVSSMKLNPAEYLHLTSVDSDDAEHLVINYLGVECLGESLKELIYRRAEGHPFYTIEFVKALQEAFYIRILDGEAHLSSEVSQTGPMDFPGTIQGVITSRIDRLTQPQQLTLKVASVIGRTFAHHALENIYPLVADRLGIDDNLRALERSGITTLEPSANGQVYAFKHMIFQEVAYNMLPRKQKNQIHLAIGEFLEQEHRDELHRHLPLLAHHWDEAIGDVESADARSLTQAMNYLELAGQQAQEQFGEREAIRFIRRAKALAQDMKKRPDGHLAQARYEVFAEGTHLSAGQLQQADWALQLGDAFLGLGLLNESRTSYQEALQLYKFPVVTNSLQLVKNLLQQIGNQFVHRSFPWLLKKAKVRIQGNRNLRLLTLKAVRAYERLMKIFYYSNEGGLFVNAGLTGLNLAEMLDPSTDLTRIYANMSTVAGIIPLHGLATTYGDLSMQTAKEVDQITALGWALTSTSVYKVGICRWEETERALENASQIFLRLGDQRQYEETLAVALTALYFQGKFGESAVLSADLYRSARRREDPQTQAWGLLGLVENNLRLNKMDEVQVQAALLKQLLDKEVGLAEEIWIYGVLALNAWRIGAYKEALEYAYNGKALFLRTAPTAVYTLEGIADVAEVFLLNWQRQLEQGNEDVRKTRKAAQQAIRALRGFAGKFPVGKPAHLRFQGTYQLLSGNPKSAEEAWAKSFTAAEGLLMPYDMALAQLELARQIAINDPAREVHLQAAIESLTQLNATYDLARAEGLSGKA